MRTLLCLALVTSLSACDRDAEPPGPEVSANQVAAELAEVNIQPGQWQATTEILSAEGPLPQAMLKKMVGKRTSQSNCITPEQARRPDARFLAAQQSSQCTYQSFSMNGGRLEGRMTCTSDEMPGEMVTAMSGDYGPRSYDIKMNMSPALPGGASMKIIARARGKHVGACG